MQYIFLLILFLSIIYPNQVFSQTTVTGKFGKLKFTLLKEIDIDKNNFSLGNPVDLAVGKNGSIYIADEAAPAIYKYDTHGNQVKKIGDKGRGPYEFQKPSSIYSDGKTIGVWDKSQLRFLLYGNNGENLLEINDFARAVSYIRKKDNLLMSYNSGGTNSIITIYDLKEKKLVKNIGRKSDTQKVLMRLTGSGGMELTGNNLLFVNPHQTILYEINLTNFKTNTYPFKVDNFKVPHIEDALFLINNNRKRLQEILLTSSVVNGLQVMDDYITIEVHTGQFEPENSTPIENRTINYIIMDKKYNLLDIIKISERNFFGTTTRSSYKNQLYVLYKKIQNNNKGIFSLGIWQIEPNK